MFILPYLTSALATEFMTTTPSDFLHLQSSSSIVGRCIRAASGHAAQPPRIVTEVLASHGTINPGGPTCRREYRIGRSTSAGKRAILQSATPPEVGLGSKTGNAQLVHLLPAIHESGYSLYCRSPEPGSQGLGFSWFRAKNDPGIVSPIALAPQRAEQRVS